jgi:hypothetical protein
LLSKQLLSTGDVQLSLWSPTGEHDFDFPPSRSLRLVKGSDDAKRIVWADCTTLHVIDMATGQDRTIATFPVPSIRNFEIDNVGDVVAAVADPSASVPPQLYLVPVDGSGPKTIAPREHGYREAAVSGDGRFVFGTTLDGALVRIDTATNQMSEIVTGPPTVDMITGGNANSVNPTVDLVPGSQYRITGSSLNDSISLGGSTLRVLSASARFDSRYLLRPHWAVLHFISPGFAV